MAKEEDVKSLTKAITALKQTAATTATNLAKSDLAISAINGAVGDIANIPLFKSGASAAKFLGGKALSGAGALAGKIKGRGKSGSTDDKNNESKSKDGGAKRDPKTGRFMGKDVDKEAKSLEKIQESPEFPQVEALEKIESESPQAEALEKIQETGEAQLVIQEGNEEEEKVERVKNDENRREETGILVRVADGIETLVDNALNPKVAEAEGGGFLAGILGMLFGSFSFGSILKKISKPFSIFKNGFSKIGAFFKNTGSKFGKIFEPVGKFFRGFSDKIKSAPKLLNKAFPFIKNIGKFITRIAGKILVPITILLAAFDFITGFLKGYKEGGIVEGIKQGFMGMISGFVDSLLNMLKGAFSWIAKKLGFEELANLLDSFTFDFAGLYGQVFDKVHFFITEKIMPFVTGMFSGLFEKAGTFLTETVLPWITGFWEGLSFGNIMESIQTYIITPLTSMFDSIIEFFTNMNLMEKIDEFLIQPLTNMFNSIIEFFTNLELPSLDDITGMIPNFDSIKGMFGFGDDDEESTGSVVDSIVQNAEGMAMSAEELVTAIFDKIGAAGSSAAATVVSTVNNLTSGGSSTTVIPTGFDTKTDPSMGRESWISDF